MQQAHQLVCNPGVVSETLTCIYASAVVNWFENKVNQFTAARTPYEPGLHKALHVSHNTMRRQQTEDIIKFLKGNIEPLDDNAYGAGYRASVYLTDGTFLPCVIFRNPNTIVDLAIRRFKEEQSIKSIFSRSSGIGYHKIVKTFVASGNCINEYDIDRVEKSKFAFPLRIQKQILGETTMGWTGFAAKMKDEKCFGFGTSFNWEFFQMPEGYSVDDIEEIINHSYVLKSGELRTHTVPFFEQPDDYEDAVIYRERPFFQCFIDNL
ncbi:MAG: hypothetical protein ACK458_09245 [Sphingobacteriales bacterium]